MTVAAVGLMYLVMGVLAGTYFLRVERREAEAKEARKRAAERMSKPPNTYP